MASDNAKFAKPMEGPVESTNSSKTVERDEKLESMAEAGREAVEANLDVAENVETNGEISETSTKGKEQKAGGGGQSAIAQVKAGLLNNLPAEKIMRAQVQKEINRQIDYLHTKAMKMVRKPGEANYFELANILKKIRELKAMLMDLAKLSFEHLKTLWLRFVHGIM